jgi:hypothetical protein
MPASLHLCLSNTLSVTQETYSTPDSARDANGTPKTLVTARLMIFLHTRLCWLLLAPTASLSLCKAPPRRRAPAPSAPVAAQTRTGACSDHSTPRIKWGGRPREQSNPGAVVVTGVCSLLGVSLIQVSFKSRSSLVKVSLMTG